MAQNTSSGGANRNRQIMKFNKTFNPKNNDYQKSNSKTMNFMKGKTMTKPFKNI